MRRRDEKARAKTEAECPLGVLTCSFHYYLLIVLQPIDSPGYTKARLFEEALRAAS